MSKQSRILIAFVLTLALLVPAGGASSQEQPAAPDHWAYIYPGFVATIPVGVEINVPVVIAGAENLHGIAVQVFYDQNVVSATVLQGVAPSPDLVVAATSIPGHSWYVVTASDQSPSFSGEGVVFYLRLRGLSPATRTLHLVVAGTDRSGIRLPIQEVDRNFRVVPNPWTTDR